MTQTDNNTPLKPITKWVGGKRQLLPELHAFLPESFNNYFEPFLGGGALFFSLAPKNAIVSDLNHDLINLYKTIKNNLPELIKTLKIHKKNNSKEYYLKLRALDRNNSYNKLSSTERAARILYMLKVDFNGLYRVNSKSQFNVPYGRYKNPKIVDIENLTAVSNYLKNNYITFLTSDFEEAVGTADKSDLVYFDPPYIPLSETSSFTSYTSDGFTIKDQERLRDTFFKLSTKGTYVMLSNSDTPLTHKLYEGANIHSVSATRAINANAKRRGKVGELIITNY